MGNKPSTVYLGDENVVGKKATVYLGNKNAIKKQSASHLGHENIIEKQSTTRVEDGNAIEQPTAVHQEGVDVTDGQFYDLLVDLYNGANSFKLKLQKDVSKYALDNFTDPYYDTRLTFKIFELPGQGDPYAIIWPCKDIVVLYMFNKLFTEINEMLAAQPEFQTVNDLKNIKLDMKSTESILATKRKIISSKKNGYVPNDQTSQEINNDADKIPKIEWPTLKNGVTDVIKIREKLVTFAILNDMASMMATYENAVNGLMQIYK